MHPIGMLAGAVLGLAAGEGFASLLNLEPTTKVLVSWAGAVGGFIGSVVLARSFTKAAAGSLPKLLARALVPAAIGVSIWQLLGIDFNFGSEGVNNIVNSLMPFLVGAGVFLTVKYGEVIRNKMTAVMGSLAVPLRKVFERVLLLIFGTANTKQVIFRAIAGLGIASAINSLLRTEEGTVKDGITSWIIGISTAIAAMPYLRIAFGYLFASAIPSGGSSLMSQLATRISGLVQGSIAAAGITLSSLGRSAFRGFRIFSAASMIDWLMGDAFYIGEGFWERLASGILSGTLIGKFFNKVRAGIILGAGIAILQAWNAPELVAAVNAFGGLFSDGSDLHAEMEKAFSVFKDEGGWFVQLLTSNMETGLLAAWVVLRNKGFMIPALIFGMSDYVEDAIGSMFGGVDFGGSLSDAVKGGVTGYGLASAMNLALAAGGMTPYGRLAKIGWTIGTAIVTGIVSYFNSSEAGQAILRGLDDLWEATKNAWKGDASDFVNIGEFSYDSIDPALRAFSTLSTDAQAELYGLKRTIYDLEEQMVDLGRGVDSGTVTNLLARIDNETNAIAEMIERIQSGNVPADFDISVFEANIAKVVSDIEMSVNTIIGDLKAKGRESALQGLQSALDSLNFNSLRDGITSAVKSGMQGASVSGPKPGYANGGYISGPGGPRSDSIPAMLSNGEFVINAASTRKFGPLLEAINDGTYGGFSTGGSIGSFSLGSASGSTVAANSSVPLDSGKSIGFFQRVLEANVRIFAGLGKGLNGVADVVEGFNAELANSYRTYSKSIPLTAEQEAAEKARQQAVADGLIVERDAVNGKTGLTNARRKLTKEEKEAQKRLEEWIKRLKEAFATRDPGEVGLNMSEKIMQSFESGLNSFLTGETSFKGFAKQLLDIFTSNVISTFVGGFTDAIFSDEGLGLGRVFQRFFANMQSSFSQSANKAMTSENGIFKTFTANFDQIFSKIGTFFSILFGGGSPAKLADGGFVSGSGGPRSDSIPAMLSNGEFVVNAESTRRFRPLLDAMNKGMVPKGFANGGMVESSAVTSLAPRSSGEGGNVEINLGVTGDISRQTRQEVRRMIPEIASQLSAYQRDRNR
jgi:hypothetical protein